MVGGYAEMPHLNPNPKSCSKCYKMPESNFSFLGATFMVGGMLKWPILTLTLKVVPNVTKCLDQTFQFWVWCSWLGGMLKWPTLMLTLKVVPNVTKCPNPTFHFWVWHAWLGVCWKYPIPAWKCRFANVRMKLKFTSFLFRHKISDGKGEVDCKMHYWLHRPDSSQIQVQFWRLGGWVHLPILGRLD